MGVPIAFFLVALGVTEANKAYWDNKVRKWCEEDGGVTVFEKVVLTPKEFKRNDGEKFGFIRVPSDKSSDVYKYDYYYKSEKPVVIKKSNPSVTRSEYITYRKSDNKILGALVVYRRVGGDLFYVDVASKFSCFDIEGMERKSAKIIFSVQGESRIPL